MILLRGIAQFLWKPDFRSIDHTIVSGQISLAGIHLGLAQVSAGIGAILLIRLDLSATV